MSGYIDCDSEMIKLNINGLSDIRAKEAARALTILMNLRPPSMAEAEAALRKHYHKIAIREIDRDKLNV